MHFAGQVVPPEVRVGQHIGFVGHLRTYNVGEWTDVSNALLLTKKWHVILDGIVELLPGAIAPEAEPYGPEPERSDVESRLELPEQSLP